MIRDVTQLAYMLGLELPCVIGQIHTNKNLLRSKIPTQVAVAVGGVPHTQTHTCIDVVEINFPMFEFFN